MPHTTPAATDQGTPSPDDLWLAFERAARRRPGATCVIRRRGEDELRETWSGVRRLALAQARSLLVHGVRAGEQVLLAAETRLEWLVADLAIAAVGAVSVPLDVALPRSELAGILQDCDARLGLVSGAFEAERLIDAWPATAEARLVVAFDAETQRERSDRRGRRRLHINELSLPTGLRLIDTATWLEVGASLPNATLDERLASRRGGGLTTIIRTAATTGAPRGVQWTSDALLFEASALGRALHLQQDDRVMLALPLTFAFARVVAWTSLCAGAELALPEGRTLRLTDLAFLEPTIVPAVPRQLAALAVALRQRIHGHGNVRRRLLGWATSVGTEVSQLRLQGEAPTGWLRARNAAAAALVLGRFPVALGGRVRALISGGAPLPVELAEWYHAVGLDLLEGYGLTECCACATLARPGFARIGTVGRPLDGVEIAIAEDGEVLLRGANLMAGYERDPAGTAAVIDDDDWLHTGDVGEFGVDGALRIVDRKGDLMRTSGGKSVAPARIEAHLQASPMIAAALVHGEGRPWLSALLSLDERSLKRFCADKDIAYTDFSEVSKHPLVYRMVERVIEERNRSLASFETIRKFAIIDREFTIEDGDLTPTLELRRAAIARKYSKLLDSFYEDGY